MKNLTCSQLHTLQLQNYANSQIARYETVCEYSKNVKSYEKVDTNISEAANKNIYNHLGYLSDDVSAEIKRLMIQALKPDRSDNIIKRQMIGFKNIKGRFTSNSLFEPSTTVFQAGQLIFIMKTV